jgi:hypothetical protein
MAALSDKSRKFKIGFYVPLITAIILMAAYVIVKAITLSFTHDEAVSFFTLVLQGGNSVFQICDANNHLLNTILMQWSYSNFGTDEFMFRLPNVVAGLVYIAGSAFFAKKLFSSPLMVLTAFLLLNCQVMVFEFFSLARGYGLALGFMMITFFSVYQLIHSRYSLIHLIVGSAAACGAAFANFTFINFTMYALVMIWILYLTQVLRKRSNKRDNVVAIGILATVSTVCIAVINAFIEMLLTLRNNAALYYGNDGFVTSIKSVFYGSFVGIDNTFNNTSDWLTYLTIAVCSIVTIAVIRVALLRKPERSVQFALFSVFGLIACVAALPLQHFLFDTLYPNLRTGVYLIPLACMTLISGSSVLEFSQPKLKSIVLYVSAVPAIVSFVLMIDTGSTFSWPESEGAKEAVTAMVNDARRYNALPGSVTVSCSVEQRPSLNYYLYKFNDSLFSLVQSHEHGFRLGCNYYWTSNSDTVLSAHFPTVFNDGAITVSRVDNTMYRKFKKVSENDFESTGNEQTVIGIRRGRSAVLNEKWRDSRLLTDTIGETTEGSVYLAEAAVKPMRDQQNCSFAVSVDRAGSNIFWKSYGMFFRDGMAGNWVVRRNAVLVPFPLSRGDIISVYVQNYDSVPMFVDDIKLWRCDE